MINELCIINALSINVNKTNFIIFCPQQRNYNLNNLQISINGNAINQVKHVKFLGVHIDVHLCWNFLIRQVANNISTSCGILAKLKSIIPQWLLLTLYNTLLLPYLSYCPLIWTSYNNANKLAEILRIQRKAVRLQTPVSLLTHFLYFINYIYYRLLI